MRTRCSLTASSVAWSMMCLFGAGCVEQSPVAAWKKGDIIRDIHRVSVPTSWKAPAVEIYAGVWKGPLRLKITNGPHDAENRVRVATVSTDQPQQGAPGSIDKKRLVATRIK